LKLVHAVVTSLGLHAAAIALVVWSHANLDTGGLAKPPVSNLQARLFTYQNGAALQEQLAVSAAGVAPDPRPPQPQELAAERPLETSRPPKPPAELPRMPAASEAVLESSALDASPVLVSSVTLEYPLSANNREGVVTLAIVVTGNGAVEDVTVVKATPPGFFEAAAIAGFRNARFTPGLLGGLGVRSRMVIEVEFMPTNRGGSVSGQK
jgi:TonB family protein